MSRAARIALAGQASATRVELATYLRDGGFAVTECEEAAALASFPSVVVVDDGKPSGVITRQDLLGYLSR